MQQNFEDLNSDPVTQCQHFLNFDCFCSVIYLCIFCSGITIGDIGPKFSYLMSGNDNGFLMFDHVRIPLNQMLMGIAKVRYSIKK